MPGLRIASLHFLTGTNSSVGAGKTASPKGLSSLAALLVVRLCQKDKAGCCVLLPYHHLLSPYFLTAEWLAARGDLGSLLLAYRALMRPLWVMVKTCDLLGQGSAFSSASFGGSSLHPQSPGTKLMLWLRPQCMVTAMHSRQLEWKLGLDVKACLPNYLKG